MKFTSQNIQNQLFEKSIPSRVFFNHFFAINYFILADSDKYDLKKIDFFNTRCNIKNPLTFDLGKLRSLLWNSWSTEYSLKTNKLSSNQEFYKFSLHWSFPQVYYSTYLSMTAFHMTQNKANKIHERSIKIFGNDVKDNVYPKAISFYAHGLYKNTQYNNIGNLTNLQHGWSGLKNIDSLDEAEQQIALFLKTTRLKNADEKKEKTIESKNKEFLNAAGQPFKRFTEEKWNVIYNSLHYTSLMNLLYRLRIKANYQDIEAFLDADIDFSKFLDSLINIVSYLNFVHESYIAKAIGLENYRQIINEFPNHMFEGNAKNRFQDLILKIIK